MADTKSEIKVGRRTLTVSNLEKVLFPKAKYTKGDIIGFYTDIADFILPHLKNRLLTMKRFPDGVGGKFFYEKNAPSHTPKWIKTVKVPRDRGGFIRYIVVNDLATLLWTVNLANIEMHSLLSTARNLERPSHMVFDLDPGPGTDVLTCAEVAFSIKKILDLMELSCFPKVSGSKGLQLYVPLNTAVTFEQTGNFAKRLAIGLSAAQPKLITAKMAKNLRRGKIFIDWSQNSDFKTTVCVYSMRAKKDTPFISMPVSWNELERALKSRKAESLYFTPEQALKRLSKVGDLFEPLLTEKQKLTKRLMDAIEEFASSASEEDEPRTSEQKKRSGKSSGINEYDRKRDFSETPEPPAKVKKSKSDPIFVIQKHDARNLHYDFRLEMQGVLRSWAVPKGPPLEPRVRRLAVQVEDHPVDYSEFEGVISPDNYGAGAVMVWDHGTYKTKTGRPTSEFKRGKLEIDLNGEKLQGRFNLIQDKRDKKHWLLMMGKSAKVIAAKNKLERSVKTSRTLNQIAAEGGGAGRGK